jgi:uncharacterized membrane protein YhdT
LASGKSSIWILSLSFIAILILSVVLDQLRPPGGWIALEFPAWIETAPGHLPENWSPSDRDAAQWGLGLDFLYLMLYPLFLSVLCAQASLLWNLPRWLTHTTRLFSRLVWLAAPLDALENAGLFFLIRGNDAASLQWFISLVSAPKWIIALTASFVGMLCLTVRFFEILRKG